MGRRYRDRGALQLGRAVVAALIRQLVFVPWGLRGKDRAGHVVEAPAPCRRKLFSPISPANEISDTVLYTGKP
jgi:hypothetical protein